MTETENKENSKPRFRSPPYPSISLSKAIDRCKQLYGLAMHHPAASGVLGEAWGYGEKSSGLWATAAALLQYGLATDEGSGARRKLILSDKAMRIIRDADPDSEKRKNAIQAAAVNPTIFAELIEHFGTNQNVSDVILKNYLILDRGESGKSRFSDQAADDLIAVFKHTIDYAGVRDTDVLTLHEEDKVGDEDLVVSRGAEKNSYQDSHIEDKKSSTSQSSVEAKMVEGERELTTGLLSKDAAFRLIVTGKVGAKEIDRLIAKLELDKEILADNDTE